MKSKLLIFIALVALSATSCKKDYVCECKDSTSGEVVLSSTLSNTTKAQADISCNLLDEADLNCSIK